MNKIKQQILEEYEDAQFIKGLDDKLYGYAEMFGEDCIVLYEGVNFMRYTSPADCQEKIDFCAPKARKMSGEGCDHCLIGHVKLDNGEIRLVYDREAVIEQFKAEYMQDDTGLFNGEEDCESSAREFYYYNTLGTYMDGIPVFAVVMRY